MPPHSVTEIFLENPFFRCIFTAGKQKRISHGKKISQLLIAALIPNLACIIATDHSRWQTAFLLDINLVVFLLFSDEKLSLKLPAPSQKTVQCILWASVTAMVCGMTTECHFSNILTGICLKIARGFKYFYTLFFS